MSPAAAVGRPDPGPSSQLVGFVALKHQVLHTYIHTYIQYTDIHTYIQYTDIHTTYILHIVWVIKYNALFRDNYIYMHIHTNIHTYCAYTYIHTYIHIYTMSFMVLNTFIHSVRLQERLEFDIAVCNLPRATRILFKIFGRSRRKSAAPPPPNAIVPVCMHTYIHIHNIHILLDRI